ncbi:sulfatase [Chlorella sorokiniana]|uniref:Sulfatase n=1 Tax=Chlorella sorokiniana TaxID=3076 RepID=A0A2P6TYY7_CHLSO|nr:sulfatase [Chlorella sorokiniana]|eukprot:PRW59250.1 sulfatase [Chlorella sorokiniana]
MRWRHKCKRGSAWPNWNSVQRTYIVSHEARLEKRRPLHLAATAVPPSGAGGGSGSGDTGKESPASVPCPASKRRQDALESQVQHQIRMEPLKQFEKECRQLDLRVEELLRRQKEQQRQADAKRQRAESTATGSHASQPDAVMGGDWHMPRLRKYLAEQGVNMTQYITDFALCCPSRTSILTGQCSHNTGVVGVGVPNVLGGFTRFNEMGMEHKTAPLTLQAAGYRTGLIGKYLNGYWDATTHHVPPGWERWFAIANIDYYNWTASDQGKRVHYGDAEEDYNTDVLTGKALEFLDVSKDDERPFFLYLAPYACHMPHLPPKRHIGKLAGLKVPRVASWNESDEHLAKKVTFVKDLPPITEEQGRAYDYRYQTRAETLLAVDDMLEAVVQKLKEMNHLDNTYILYTADNGYKLGHKRLSGKLSGYESDIRLPFYVRGPGVPRGVELPHLISNIDLASTWLDLAGVQDPLAEERDGVSFAPVLRGEPEALEDPERHRVALLVEKPVPTGIFDTKVSIMVPDVPFGLKDPFKGLRPERLPNGSWPLEVLEAEFGTARRFNEQVEEQVRKGIALPIGDEEWLKPEMVAQLSLTGLRQYIDLAKAQGLSEEAIVRASENLFPIAYYGLRTSGGKLGRWKYLEYPNGQFELYNLDDDPYEVNNVFSEASPALVAALARTLNLLKTCRGATCTVKSVSVDAWQ